MLSTFGAFEAAKSGLSVSMQQLNVTEQNIANVNTEGYTRQRILTSAKEPASAAYLIAQLSKANVGQGVESTGIQQIRSAYLDQQYRNLNSNYSDSSSRDTSLTYLSGLFNELNDDSSMTTSVNNFFTALNTFSSDTSSQSSRTNVQQQAASMTESFRNIYQEMQSLWKDQNSSILTTTQTINATAQKIASLNDLIAKSEATAGTANDLVDQRNNLLDQLAGYVNITYTNNPSNGSMVNVAIGGQMLVNGKTANAIGVSSISDLATQIAALNQDIASNPGNAATDQAAIATLVNQMKSFTTGAPANITTQANGTDVNQVDVLYNGISLVKGVSASSADTVAGGDVAAWADLSRNNLTIAGGTKPLSIEKGTVTGGQLYANMKMVTSMVSADPGIPYYMDQLNTLVRTMARNINDIQLQGYTYPDSTNGNTSAKGVDLFFRTDLASPVLNTTSLSPAVNAATGAGGSSSFSVNLAGIVSGYTPGEKNVTYMVTVGNTTYSYTTTGLEATAQNVMDNLGAAIGGGGVSLTSTDSSKTTAAFTAAYNNTTSTVTFTSPAGINNTDISGLAFGAVAVKGVKTYGVPVQSVNTSGTPVVDGFGKPVYKTDGSGNLVYNYDNFDALAYKNVTAGNFSLSDAVQKNIFSIAGSSTKISLSGASPDTGNNVIALQLTKDLDNSGYKDIIGSITAHLAITSKTATSVADTKKSLLNSIDTQRKSTSAVSLDEETTNLIVFQQSYNAAARVITTLDDMLNRMISNMGITGT